MSFKNNKTPNPEKNRISESFITALSDLCMKQTSSMNIEVEVQRVHREKFVRFSQVFIRDIGVFYESCEGI